jgi:TPR repeat protein
MPTPQEKLKEDLRRVRGLEKLLQRPNLSDRARSKLESALRMQKAAVKLARKAMTAPDESGAKRTAGGSAPPRKARKKRDVSNPGPEALLEEFNRGFAFDNHVREELNYDQMNALADMFLGWAFNEGSDPKRTAWLTGMAEGLLEEADTLGPDWSPAEPEELSGIGFMARLANGDTTRPEQSPRWRHDHGLPSRYFRG